MSDRPNPRAVLMSAMVAAMAVGNNVVVTPGRPAFDRAPTLQVHRHSTPSKPNKKKRKPRGKYEKLKLSAYRWGK